MSKLTSNNITMFTRQHYEAIAEILSHAESNKYSTRQEVFDVMRDSFITLFAKDNPRFDVKKFTEASRYHA